MQSENFSNLTPYATKLLIDFLSQYTGFNNGDLTAAWSLMSERGWRSKATLYKAIKELIDRGWIIKSRQGGKHKCSLYAVTWESIDECKGKLDISSTNVPADCWKDPDHKKIGGTYMGHISTPPVPIPNKQALN